MRDMGAGWIRDGQAWPAAEPTPDTYDTEHHDRVTRTMRRHGLSPLEVMSPAPEWAMTTASLPSPTDLRHAYRYARRLASRHPAAVQFSNEPDVDVTSSTGDAHAAFVKAAALGIADTPTGLSSSCRASRRRATSRTCCWRTTSCGTWTCGRSTATRTRPSRTNRPSRGRRTNSASWPSDSVRVRYRGG